MSHKIVNLDSASKLKAGTPTSTPKRPERTILKAVRTLPTTVKTSESNSSDEQPFFFYQCVTNEKVTKFGGKL